MTPGELRRLYFIIHTFLSYGLDELIPKMRITLPLRIWRRMLFWMPNRHQDQPLGARLRLALREQGPVWIKFGQMLSTRRDLFPPHIADQLALLQDRVAPFEGKLAQQQIEKAMGGLPVEAWFDDFSVEPLASASIAQVHTARLKENGKEVVIKVIRPDILPIIKADMKLIYRLARWVPRLLPDGRRLRPQEVVREYEKTLLDELNLLRESANAIQLRRNFEDSPMLYVPEVYPDYCSESMMVMERICNIPGVRRGGARGSGNQYATAGGAGCAGLLHPGVPRQLFPCRYAPWQHLRQLRAPGRSAVYWHRLRHCRLAEQRR